MTKDEVIAVLRAALTRLQRECDLEGLRQRAGFDCWLSIADDALADTAAIDAPISEASSTDRDMAACMDMVRDELIQAGIIDRGVAPMFVANAVFAYVSRLAQANSLTAAQDGMRDAARYQYLREHAYVEIECTSPRTADWMPSALDERIDAYTAAASITPREPAP